MKRKTPCNNRKTRVETLRRYFKSLTRSQWAYVGQIVLLTFAATMAFATFATMHWGPLVLLIGAVIEAFWLERYRD
jgi:hypothetical protein